MTNAPDSPKGSGLMLGQVVDAGTGRPVTGAIVTLTTTPASDRTTDSPEEAIERLVSGILPSGSADLPVLTDGEGRFVFRDLVKGRHNLRVTAPGYVPALIGQTAPGGPGEPLELDEGERRLDVVLRMWKHAAVTGTVVDEAGEPLVGATVRAYRQSWTNGRRRLVISGSTTTDDRGMYRLGALVPGEYVINVPSTVTSVPISAVEAYAQAMARGATAELSRQRSESGAPAPFGMGMRVGDIQYQLSGSNRIVPGADGRLRAYPTVFYPSVTGGAEATAFQLGSGEERTGIELRLQPVSAVRVSGTLNDPNGPAANVGVRLVIATHADRSSDSGFEAATTTTDANGGFVFPAVPPGQYVLKAWRVPRALMQTIATTGGGITFVTGVQMSGAAAVPTYFAQTTVTVGETDIDGLTLHFRAGARVSGRVAFNGTAERPAPQRVGLMSVSLTPLDGQSLPTVPATRADQQGAFTTAGYPPGRYAVNVSSPGPQWTIESILVNGVDALRVPLELGETDLSGAIVTFTDRQTEVSGTVQRASGDSGPITVIAFPTNYRSAVLMPRHVASTTVDANGAYRLRIAVPGDYFVAAVPSPMAFDQSPQALASLERVAVRVSLSTGDHKTQPLTLGTQR